MAVCLYCSRCGYAFRDSQICCGDSGVYEVKEITIPDDTNELLGIPTSIDPFVNGLKRIEMSDIIYNPPNDRAIRWNKNDDKYISLLNSFKLNCLLPNLKSRKIKFMSDFIGKPWTVSATSLTCKRNVKKVFDENASVFKISNIESKIIDKLVGSEESVQAERVLQLDCLGTETVNVFVNPDYVWEHDGIVYVIEYKTIAYDMFLNGIIRGKMIEWLNQVAAYQIPASTETDQNDLNSNNPPPAIKYLLVIILVKGENLFQYEMLVLEVKSNNFNVAKNEWNEWFNDASLGDIQYKVKLMNLYNAGEGEMDFVTVLRKNEEHRLAALEENLINKQTKKEKAQKKDKKKKSIYNNNRFGAFG